MSTSQQTALMAIDSGVVHRLLMHPDRNLQKHGGVSVIYPRRGMKQWTTREISDRNRATARDQIKARKMTWTPGPWGGTGQR